jgi:hypothetical protein
MVSSTISSSSDGELDGVEKESSISMHGGGTAEAQTDSGASVGDAQTDSGASAGDAQTGSGVPTGDAQSKLGVVHTVEPPKLCGDSPYDDLCSSSSKMADERRAPNMAGSITERSSAGTGGRGAVPGGVGPQAAPSTSSRRTLGGGACACGSA